MASIQKINMSVYNNNLAVTQYLLDQGANPNIQDKYGYTSIFWAVQQDSIAMVEILIQKGADKNVLSFNGETVFDLASENVIYILK